MRYFAVDDITHGDNSFVTACRTEQDEQNLFENCCECLITEITKEQYDAYQSV